LAQSPRGAKLHAVTDTSGRPVRLFITAGQVSDYTGAAALMNGLPEAEWLLADRGYDADLFRETLVDKGTKPCIPGRKSRKKAVTNDATVSRECSEGSKIGAASQLATTDHQQSSSPQPSYSGYESLS
jgi:IS5 family transposase